MTPGDDSPFNDETTIDENDFVIPESRGQSTAKTLPVANNP